VRLTLRTLLAYLDDTLDPGEIKQIGQKVAESDAAQELIARIKQVTRRRRLTAPPNTGPGGFDPNTIAEYLDNVLPPDQVSELEKTCLESDVHLAEMAASHQILTLILGEPLLVPPTAKQRMYGLVRGRESSRRRAPASTVPVAAPAGVPPAAAGDAEDASLLGLPLSRRSAGGWTNWLLGLTALCLAAAIGVIVWQATHSATGPVVAEASTKKVEQPPPTPPQPPVTPAAATEKEATPPMPMPATTARETPKEVTPPQPMPPPSAEAAREVGHMTPVQQGPPNLLLRREPGKDQWQNLRIDKSGVGARDTLLALPGYRSEVRFDNGVGLLLWGNLPEFLSLPLLESSVVLQPSSDFDLEFTLDRGRVAVSNLKPSGPVKVRVHFNEVKALKKPPETWDLTLQEPGTEIIMELAGRYVPEIPFQKEGGEPPVADFNLVVAKGEASAKVDAATYSLRGPPSGPSVLYWNNYGKGVSPPARLNPQAQTLVDKARPTTKVADDAEDSLKELLRRLVSRAPDKPIESVVEESLQSDSQGTRVLGVLCLGALDAAGKVVDALADDDERHSDLREAAVQELRQWTGRRGDPALYEILTQRKRYTPSQAETIMQMLHGFTEEQLRQPQTWEALIGYVKSDKAPIRTLAYWHLWRHYPDGRQPKYNPAGDSKQRDVAYTAWSKLLESGKLPPKPMQPMGPPAAAPPPKPSGT
jgi:hypothetical protein